MPEGWKLSKAQQWLATCTGVVLAGAPFTPLSHYMEESLMDLITVHPVLAGCLMGGHFLFSVLVVRFLFLNVLDPKRFSQNPPPSPPSGLSS